MKESKFMVIKDDEFAVLCALYGITHFFGTLEMGAAKLSKQEIYALVYQLYKKDLLVYDNDKIVLTPSIKMIGEGIKRATRLLSLVNPVTSENHSFYYTPHADWCINLQKGWEDPNSIRLRYIDKEEVILVGEEAELLPKQLLDEVSIQNVQLDEAETVLKEYLVLNVYDLNTDERLVEIQVGMASLNAVLVYRDETMTYKEVYVLDRLKRLITTLLQGEKHYDNG